MPNNVFILTTKGPVRIQRLTEEAAGLRSVVCLNGTATTLPISPHYDAFVRAPTGVIERMTGHAAYRLDVDGAIDMGQSWQLAVYLTHALHRSKSDIDGPVFVTGEVDHDLTVRPVEGIQQKFDTLRTYFDTQDASAEKPIVIIPKASAVEDGVSNFARIVQVDTVADALDAIGATRRLKPEKRRENRQMLGLRPGLLVLGLLLASLASVAGGMFVWSQPMWEAASDGALLRLETELNRANVGHPGERVTANLYDYYLQFQKPDAAKLKMEIDIQTSADRSSCLPERRVSIDTTEHSARTSDPTCEVVWRAFSTTADDMIVGRLGFFDSTSKPGDRPARTLRGSQRPDGREWRIAFGEPPSKGARLRLVAIYGSHVITGDQPWYADFLTADLESLRFESAVTRLSDLGYRTVVREWHQD